MRPLEWVVLLLCAGAAYTLWPLWAPLTLAIWVAALIAPTLQRLSGGGHKRGIAALLTMALVVTVLTPLVLIGVSLASAAVELTDHVLHSKDQTQALKAIFFENSPGAPAIEEFGVPQLAALVRKHGQSAVAALSAVAGATTKGVIGAVVFVLATYTFLVDGPGLYGWFAERMPVRRPHVDRLAHAFLETGRGLLLGTGLTALIQGGIATLGYALLGIPRALVLGFLTAVSALIPSVGTALVWVPVAAGLAFNRRYAAAGVLLAIGAAISLIDNFLRPVLSRRGSLRLPSLAVFVAMLGGIAVFGGWGLLLGPLLVRLAVEGLEIRNDARTAGAKLARRTKVVSPLEQRPS